MTTARRIDLNSDLGESLGTWAMGNDAAMLDIVTSANVACGFHAGDSLTLQRTCAQAAERGVVVGAQVGYQDLAGFGRRFIDIGADELDAPQTRLPHGASGGRQHLVGDVHADHASLGPDPPGELDRCRADTAPDLEHR